MTVGRSPPERTRLFDRSFRRQGDQHRGRRRGDVNQRKRLGSPNSGQRHYERDGMMRRGQAIRAATPQAALRPSMHHCPGPSQSAGRTGLAGWLPRCCDRRSSKASNAARGQANEAPATAPRTGFNRAGGHLLPVHGRWRPAALTERGRFDPPAAPSEMTVFARSQGPDSTLSGRH